MAPNRDYLKKTATLQKNLISAMKSKSKQLDYLKSWIEDVLRKYFSTVYLSYSKLDSDSFCNQKLAHFWIKYYWKRIIWKWNVWKIKIEYCKWNIVSPMQRCFLGFQMFLVTVSKFSRLATTLVNGFPGFNFILPENKSWWKSLGPQWLTQKEHSP